MKNLLKLSRETIPKFLEIYNAASYPRHAVTCTTFKNVLIQTEKFPEFKDKIELLTLNDDWQKDGLFAIKNGQSYYLDSLEQNPFGRLKELLLNIDYSNEVFFPALRDELKPTLIDVLWLKNAEITDQNGATAYYLPRKVALSWPQLP